MKKKPKGIVITTSPHTYRWLDDCIASVEKLGYPILLVINDETSPVNMLRSDDGNRICVVNDWNGFELGGIMRGAEYFDEFVHLMDTCVVRNPEMIEKMFQHDGSVYLCKGFFSYLGKYKSDVLAKVGIPRVENKEMAIHHERYWHERYLACDRKAIQFDPPLPITTDLFERKYDRQNMVLGNGYITKWKATWR